MLDAGLKAAEQSAKKAAQLSMRGANTEAELSSAEAAAAVAAREAAQEAAAITTQTVAREMAKARLLDPQVSRLTYT